MGRVGMVDLVSVGKNLVNLKILTIHSTAPHFNGLTSAYGTAKTAGSHNKWLGSSDHADLYQFLIHRNLPITQALYFACINVQLVSRFQSLVKGFFLVNVYSSMMKFIEQDS